MADVEYGSIPRHAATSANISTTDYDSAWQVKKEESHEELAGIVPASVHNNFIKKVYSLLGVELLITAIVATVMTLVTPIRNGVIDVCVKYTVPFEIFVLVGIVGSACFLRCVAKRYPINMYALALFLAFVSIDVGCVCAIYYAAGLGKLILLSVFITAGIFLALSAYAWISYRDFSYMGGFLFAALIGLLILGIVQCFVHFKWLDILYCVLGILIFSGYVIYDTWMIKTRLGPDDALVASIQLYMDIINLFMLLLEFLGDVKR